MNPQLHNPKVTRMQIVEGSFPFEVIVPGKLPVASLPGMNRRFSISREEKIGIIFSFDLGIVYLIAEYDKKVTVCRASIPQSLKTLTARLWKYRARL